MADSARLAEQKDVRLHTHLAETEDETQYCQKLFGMRPLDYLEATGWLSDRTWLAHGIHFNDDEVACLAEIAFRVAHLQEARSKVDLLAEETKSLDKFINEQAKEAATLGGLEKRLTELQRDLKVKRSVYEELLERQEMARISGALGAFEKEKRNKLPPKERNLFENKA